MLIVDLFDRLLTDHDRLRDLLRRIDRTSERGARLRERLWNEAKHELRLHARLEEAYLHPPLSDAPSTRQCVHVSVEEMREALILVEDVEEMPFDDPRWKPRFSAFKAHVEGHLRGDEAGLFPEARKLLGAADSEAIAERMDAARQASRSRASRPPRTPQSARPVLRTTREATWKA